MRCCFGRPAVAASRARGGAGGQPAPPDPTRPRRAAAGGGGRGTPPAAPGGVAAGRPVYVPTPFCPVCIFFFSARLGVFSVLLSCFFFSLRFYALVFCRIKCVWVVYHQGRTAAPGCVTRAPGFSRVGDAGGCPCPVRAGRAWQSRQIGGAPLLCRRRSGESQGALSTRVCPNQTPPAATLRAGRARTRGGRGGGSRETGPSWAFSAYPILVSAATEPQPTLFRPGCPCSRRCRGPNLSHAAGEHPCAVWPMRRAPAVMPLQRSKPSSTRARP